MSDLAEFLLARIAEDEAVAQKAIEEIGKINWVPGAEQLPTDNEPLWVNPDGMFVVVCAYPARVFAECEAKRRIVHHAVEALARSERTDVWGGWPDTKARADGEWLLALLAVPYAAHPDYREEWKP